MASKCQTLRKTLDKVSLVQNDMLLSFNRMKLFLLQLYCIEVVLLYEAVTESVLNTGLRYNYDDNDHPGPRPCLGAVLEHYNCLQ